MNSHKMFNAVLKDFFGELRAAYPGDEGIHKAKRKIKNVTKVSPKTPCSLFRESMKPFGTLIMEKNEDFVYGEAGVILEKNLGIDIKTLWKTATPESKECVWNYINTLYAISSQALEVPDDAMDKIQNLASQLSTTMDLSGLEEGDFREALTSMASNIDVSAIHGIIEQISPDLAKNMLPGLESGELMRGVSNMINNLDPQVLETVGKMMTGDSADLGKLMSGFMESVDPAVMGEVMRTLNNGN